MNIKGDLAIIAIALVTILIVLIAGTLMLFGGGAETAVAEATEAPAENSPDPGPAIVGPIDEECALVMRSVSLAVRAGAGDRLVNAGAVVEAVAPAASIGPGSASLIVSEASGMNCRLSEGTLETEGGLRFTVGGKSVTVDSLTLDLAADELTADVTSPDFEDRVRLDADVKAVNSLDRGDEIIYVMPVNLLSNDAGTLEDALQKAALSEGGISSDATLTLIAART